MDIEDIRHLLGETIFSRSKPYQKYVQDVDCTTNANGERHLTARVYGSGNNVYHVQAWLRANGSFVSASCSCPYNANGDGPCCKHIGALLLEDVRMREDGLNPKIKNMPGVITGAELARRQAEQKSGYADSLKMLFGSKWRGDAAESDSSAQELLRLYKSNALDAAAPSASGAAVAEAGTVELEPLLKLCAGEAPVLRLRISCTGRSYIIKSLPRFLEDIANRATVAYGKTLTLTLSPESFTPDSQWLLRLVRRQVNARRAIMREVNYGYYGGPQSELPLSGEAFDKLFDYRLQNAGARLGGYCACDGMPQMRLDVERRHGGVQITLRPKLYGFAGLDYYYIVSEEPAMLWRVGRAEGARVMPALNKMSEGSMFFTTKDASAFCSYVLPELGHGLKINDPERLLLNQIPMEPVVQFYLDAPREGAVSAYAEFVYGEDKVSPFAPAPANLLRDARTEARAARLLQSYLTGGEDGNPAVYSTDYEDELYRFLDDGIPALMAMGEVYLSDAFRRMQAAPPKISVGVSVHGSVLDLDVDTGEFPLEELHELMQSLHKKKRYHRLRDGRLLKLDSSMEALDELGETLEMSGASLGQAHAQLPLYRAPTLDRALSGQSGISFSRDDAFRRISRSFHAVKDSEYIVPQSLQHVLRKYQRDGYRWLCTLDGYGMGGILADDMGLGKTLQVLTFLLARKQGAAADGAKDTPLPSLIVCPASLVLNWAEECAKFTPELRCVAVDGDAAHRAELAAKWAGADLVVTSYDLLRRDQSLYEKQEFYACILDEAQAIKNHATQKYKAVCRINSRVRFALTGTPVENRLGELWSIFSFLMPGYLPPYKLFVSRFEKPIAQDNDENAARRLNQLTGPFILRRMKSEVLKELPPKTESVYRIELETEQRKLYLAAVVDAREKLRAAKPEDKMAVFAVLMRLREICCDPRLVAENWSGGSAKLDACMELAASAVEGGHRILLFSQFTSMLELLAKRLDEESISHFTLQGSTPKPERAELVRRFNGGEASVFLISLRAGGTGLNLTAADIVIHYDPWWNVAAQNQATDRAYRIGQQNPVQVYKLIAQDTIEEKILELQQAKQSLAETVTGSADGAILSMKPEELLELLEGE